MTADRAEYVCLQWLCAAREEPIRAGHRTTGKVASFPPRPAGPEE